MTSYDSIFCAADHPDYESLMPEAYASGQLVGWDEIQAMEWRSLTSPPVFGDVASHLQGDGAGKKTLLFKAMEQVCGKYLIHKQEIGDCVSHGAGSAVDLLKCVQIAVQNKNEAFVAETATEVIYGLSRYEIGGQRHSSSDGSTGGWAAKAVRTYGTLLRQAYTAGGTTYDFTKYSGKTAKSLGYYGCPDALEPATREHPVQDTAMVATWEQLCDAIYHGYPVTVASNQGFAMKRDGAGFAAPQGSWAHQMHISAVDDTGSRPGALIQNSWGPDWISGPKKDNQPDGSFWADKSVVSSMISKRDSYAYSSFVGFPGRGPLKPNYDNIFGA